MKASGAKVPEILAPAGGPEAFWAALNAGADAVYLGLKAFNARARAHNFTIDELRGLKPIADQYGMKILITVNILIKQSELPDLVATLSAIEELGVHAIIVQDLAVAALVRKYFPGIRLHASTQLAVHNLAGVIAAYKLGFQRVVVARELTGQELRHIRAGAPSEVEIEAFCHGSLCYAYSGLCFFSGADDARSGNRGECAYTCRQPYKIISEPGHGFLFSMKDLDTSDELGLMLAAGVDTLKIEGRKKDAQYVSSVVRLYRERLDAHFGMSTLRSSAPKQAVPTTPVKADLSLSFQRRTTSFFVASRYRENVIDLDNPTHQGRLAGTVQAISGRQLSFTTLVPLERFDGLRLDQVGPKFHSQAQHGSQLSGDHRGLQRKYQNQMSQFSLREFKVNEKSAFTATAGSAVTVRLPEDVLAPVVGDQVWQVRSEELRRRVESLAKVPIAARIQRQRPQIDLHIVLNASGSELLIELQAFKAAKPLGAVIRESLPLQMAAHGKSLGPELRLLFNTLGAADLQTQAFTIEGDGAYFVPRSTLKALKRRLVEQLVVTYPAWQKAHSTRILRELDSKGQALAPRNWEQRQYTVKCDRLEILEAVVRFVQQNPTFPLRQLCFEPKRAFFGKLSPEELAQCLHEIATTAGVGLRIAVPMVVRSWDEPLLKRWLQALAKVGLKDYELGNLGGLDLLRSYGLELSGATEADFSLYALNAVAADAWAAQGFRRVALSIEDDRANMRASLSHWPTTGLEPQAIIYKDTPLFIAEACSLTALHNGCPSAAVCGYRSLEVENPAGERFIVAHEACKSVVYGKRAYAISHRQAELLDLGVSDFRIDLLTRPYSAAAIGEILTACKEGLPLVDTHEANYLRGLL